MTQLLQGYQQPCFGAPNLRVCRLRTRALDVSLDPRAFAVCVTWRRDSRSCMKNIRTLQITLRKEQGEQWSHHGGLCGVCFGMDWWVLLRGVCCYGSVGFPVLLVAPDFNNNLAEVQLFRRCPNFLRPKHLRTLKRWKNLVNSLNDQFKWWK